MHRSFSMHCGANMHNITLNGLIEWRDLFRPANEYENKRCVSRGRTYPRRNEQMPRMTFYKMNIISLFGIKCLVSWKSKSIAEYSGLIIKFSKPELLTSHLRRTTSRDHLNNLITISIEKELLSDLSSRALTEKKWPCGALHDLITQLHS